MFGKSVDELQSSVVVGNKSITGTSKYVDDYSAGGFDMDLSHNFIAIKAAAESGADIKVKVIGGVKPETTLDSDGIIVLQLVPTATAIRVTATKGGKKDIHTFSIKGLKKETAPSNSNSKKKGK